MLGIDLNRFSKFYCVSRGLNLGEECDTHGDLLELVSELDNGRSTKLSGFVHAQHTVLQVVQLGFDEQQIAECQHQPHLERPCASTHEQDLTGKNRDRGTLIPIALSKCLMAAPMAGSELRLKGRPKELTSLELDDCLSSVGHLNSQQVHKVMLIRLALLLTIISRLSASSSMTRLMALRLHP